MANQVTRATAPKPRVSNFTAGFGRRTLRTCTLTTHGTAIILKDQQDRKQMSILPSKEALQALLVFCDSALREWQE
jgi:hypothetical protein